MYRLNIIYFFVLIIISFFSCSKPIIDDPNLNNNNSPVAVILGDQTGIIGELFSFDGSSSYDPDEDDAIDSYKWDFGDGVTGEGITIEHTYNSIGIFIVELIVIDTGGLESEAVHLSVIVEPALENIDARGCGFICQSLSFEKVDGISKAFNLPCDLRKNTEGLAHFNLHRISTQRFSLTKAVLPQFLMDNDSFFLIDWDNISGIDHYKINFIDPENGDQEIWDSTENHYEDPLFNLNNPQAYLDLSSECSNLINLPGNYTFRIYGYGIDGQLIAASRDLNLSIGEYIPGFPDSIIVSGNTINWTSVLNADGYRIHIYNSGENRVFAFPLNPGEITLSTLISFPELTIGEYYYCYIDSVKQDNNGDILEITRAITGFIY